MSLKDIPFENFKDLQEENGIPSKVSQFGWMFEQRSRYLAGFLGFSGKILALLRDKESDRINVCNREIENWQNKRLSFKENGAQNVF